MQELTFAEASLRLGAAFVAGALVGLDRQRHRHAAGLRTMILVSVGSALLAMIGWELGAMARAQALSAGTPVATALGPDAASRVVQGIVGGIGFLGAGVVMRSGMRVKGITSAASIWVTAALGIACGFGLYLIASLALAMTLFALITLKTLEDALPPTSGLARRDRPGPPPSPPARTPPEA